MQQAAYWALSNDGGQTFGPATLIYSSPTGPIWGPTIHVEEGKLYLLYSGTAPSQCQVHISSLTKTGCHFAAKQSKQVLMCAGVVQYEGEGGLAFPPGGDLVIVSSADIGQTWSAPVVSPLIIPLLSTSTSSV